MINIEHAKALKEKLLAKYSNYLDCQIKLIEESGESEVVDARWLAKQKNEYEIAKEEYYGYIIHDNYNTN